MKRAIFGGALALTMCGGADLWAQEYARYPSPAACMAAASRMQILTTWGTEPGDTLPDLGTKGLARETTEAAMACGARFLSPEGRAKLKDTDGLFLFALAAGDDSIAGLALRQVLARQRTRADSIDVLAHANFAFALTRPGRLEAARSAGTWLDSLEYLGDDLGTSWWSTPRESALRLAIARMDSAAVVAESEALLETVRRLPNADRTTPAAQYATALALGADLPWALRAYGVDSAVARIVARSKVALGPAGFADSSLGRALMGLGKPAPMPAADFWFRRSPGDSTLPKKGKVTLLAYAPIGCTWCSYAMLRRLQARFGSSLDVVLLAATSGRIGEVLYPDPRQEADAIRAILLDREKIDATIAVWVTRYERVPDPDRRLMGQPIPDMLRFFYAGGTMLVDRRGIAVTTVDANSTRSEAHTVSLIEALINQEAR